MDIDALNEKMRELITFLSDDSQATISSEVDSLNEDWMSLISNLESRRDTLTKLAALWEVLILLLKKSSSLLKKLMYILCFDQSMRNFLKQNFVC